MKTVWSLVLASVVSVQVSAQGAVVYRENFGATSGMQPLSNVGWQGYQGNGSVGAAAVVNGNTGVPANSMLSGGPSAPSGGENVNAGSGASVTNGFVPMLSRDGDRDFLMFTEEYSFDPAAVVGAGESVAFGWLAGSYYGGDYQRLVVRVGGAWYASVGGGEPVVVGTGGGFVFGPNSKVIEVPLVGGEWRALNFAVGSPMSLGAAVGGLPGGVIEAFGMYAEIGNNVGLNGAGVEIGDERTFFDSYEVVTVVPEPGWVSAVGLAVLGLRRGKRLASSATPARARRLRHNWKGEGASGSLRPL